MHASVDRRNVVCLLQLSPDLSSPCDISVLPNISFTLGGKMYPITPSVYVVVSAKRAFQNRPLTHILSTLLLQCLQIDLIV